MTIHQRSVLCWIGGAIVGLAVARRRRVLGAFAGAIMIGGFADVLIERGEPCPRLYDQLPGAELT